MYLPVINRDIVKSALVLGLSLLLALDAHGSTRCPVSNEWQQKKLSGDDAHFQEIMGDATFSFAADKAIELSILDTSNTNLSFANVKSKSDDTIAREIKAGAQAAGIRKIKKIEVTRQVDLILARTEWRVDKGQEIEFEVFADTLFLSTLKSPVLNIESAKSAETFILRCARGK